MEVNVSLSDEGLRLVALNNYQVLDTPEEKEFDEIVNLVAQICDKPISVVSFIDSKRLWFKSIYGISFNEAPREHSFCAEAILQDEVLEIPDTFKDQRFKENGLVTQDPPIRFYAGSPIVDKDGFKLGNLCVLDTEPNRLSLLQRQSLQVLSRQISVLLERRRQILVQERSNVIKERLISLVSHDLKNSFHVIRHSSKMIISRVVDEDIKNLANGILNISHATENQFDALLEWAKSNIVDDKQLKTEVDVVEVCNGALALVDPLASKKRITLVFDYQEEFCFLLSKSTFSSALQNLLINAIKFSYPNSRVTLKVAAVQGDLHLTVADQGSGMNEAQMKALFSNQRLISQTGTQGEKGSGFGTLFIQDFVAKHNGQIKVHSELNEGTEITLILPAAIN